MILPIKTLNDVFEEEYEKQNNYNIIRAHGVKLLGSIYGIGELARISEFGKLSLNKIEADN